ncbi:unnamed protein product, partial [Prunus brigantina]
GGSKFPEIDVFGDIYVRSRNELVKSLHTTMMEKSQLVLQESASQLPPNTPLKFVDHPQDMGFQILKETLDQTLEKRPGTYSTVAGIQIPQFGPSSTSEPLQSEHGHQTSAPVDNVQTSEPHLQNDQVDFGTSFD